MCARLRIYCPLALSKNICGENSGMNGSSEGRSNVLSGSSTGNDEENADELDEIVGVVLGSRDSAPLDFWIGVTSGKCRSTGRSDRSQDRNSGRLPAHLLRHGRSGDQALRGQLLRYRCLSRGGPFATRSKSPMPPMCRSPGWTRKYLFRHIQVRPHVSCAARPTRKPCISTKWTGKSL